MSLSKKTLGDIATANDEDIDDLIMRAIYAESSTAQEMEDSFAEWFPNITPETRSMLSAEHFHGWEGDVIILK